MKMKKAGYVLPDLGGIEGGLPRPSEKEIRRRECPPRGEALPAALNERSRS